MPGMRVSPICLEAHGLGIIDLTSQASVTESCNVLPPVKREETTMRFSNGNYDHDQINTMQAALNLACKELGITAKDKEKRERVGLLIAALGRAGQGDLDGLKSYAVYQFQNSGLPAAARA